MLKDKFGFNFWPSFTDLMLSFVLVVLIILFVIAQIIASGNESLEEVRKMEQSVQTEIKNDVGYYGYDVATLTIQHGEDPKEALKKFYGSHSGADIYIINELNRQTITFSDNALFDSGEPDLKPSGVRVLGLVGQSIKKNIDNLSEIQIQGHADITYKEDFNLKLAAERAINVYSFLQYNIGIDPAEHLMSVTSFGIYKPVDRVSGEKYSREDLTRANNTEVKKAKNRRIELVLFYKNVQ